LRKLLDHQTAGRIGQCDECPNGGAHSQTLRSLRNSCNNAQLPSC
jgi:hypothetical protein